ncbi:hypothetical protein F5X99DRAFT_367433 [Biscogniauxia marginata]|nr:hypothetical protein F5X99DRAFT_367433 [Biscogniauxia marginata]
MHFFAILAVLSVWVSAFPFDLNHPALTQNIERFVINGRVYNTSIPAVSKPDGTDDPDDDPYDLGETDNDHPERNIPLEQDIAWYNDVYYMNQIPRRVMSNPPRGSTYGGEAIQFHQYEIWNTLRIAGSVWREYQRTLQEGGEDPRPIHSASRYPRPANLRSSPLRRVPIGEFDWSDTIIEWPMMSAGQVFGAEHSSSRLEFFLLFGFREGSLDHPVFVGITTRVGHGSNRHWCPEVHFDGTPTPQQGSQGNWPLSGYDRLFQYMIPALFLRSWNPANPWDKHRRFPRAVEVDNAKEGFAPGTILEADDLALTN